MRAIIIIIVTIITKTSPGGLQPWGQLASTFYMDIQVASSKKESY